MLDESLLIPVVSELTDGREWSWTRIVSERDAARRMLMLLEKRRLIEHRPHPHGGDVWRVNGELFGRTDGVDESLFDS